MKIKNNKQIEKHNYKGFSVVELIVVISIFAIMSSVTLFNYGDYRQHIEELNVAQDVALSIRQAQIYGISASNKDVGQTFADEEDEAAFFTSTITDITDNTSIRGVAINPDTNTLTLFEDVNKNKVYNSGTDVVIDERGIITTRVQMKACLQNVAPTNFTTCTTVESGTELINVTFQRPYPDSYITYDGNAYTHVWLGFFETLSQAEPASYVVIDSSGQISVVKNAL